MANTRMIVGGAFAAFLGLGAFCQAFVSVRDAWKAVEPAHAVAPGSTAALWATLGAVAMALIWIGLGALLLLLLHEVSDAKMWLYNHVSKTANDTSDLLNRNLIRVGKAVQATFDRASQPDPLPPSLNTVLESLSREVGSVRGILEGQRSATDMDAIKPKGKK